MIETTRKGLKLTLRFPAAQDAIIVGELINALSEERTYIIYQGEKISLEMEGNFFSRLLEKITKGEAVMLLAFKEDVLVGLGWIERLDKVERHIGVVAMGVAKKFRNAGVGRLLLEKLTLLAIQNLQGLEILTLRVFSTNALGRKLYGNMGFVEYGTLPDGIKLESGYADHVLMYRTLRPRSGETE